MKPPQHRTLTFLGGGVAASIYTIVARSLWPAQDVSITVIDPVQDPPDRTLCVWGRPLPLLDAAIIAEWSQLRFGYGNESWCCELGAWTYRQYTAASLRSLVDAHGPIHRVVECAQDPTPSDILYLDSRPNQPLTKPASISLLQHFLGRRIRSSSAVFDPDTAVMMDFRTDQTDGVCFIYVLPYSSTEALVECTVFGPTVWSADQYEQRLDEYIATIIGCTEYTIVATESGVIPMNDRRVLRNRGQNWIAIGSGAAITKPTTGYMVARCFRDAQHVLAQVEKAEPSLELRKTPARFLWYDVLLLRIIRDEPGVVPKILSTLFKRNPIHRILMFLDEQTTVSQEILLFMRLPWMPFLRAIFRS